MILDAKQPFILTKWEHRLAIVHEFPCDNTQQLQHAFWHKTQFFIPKKKEEFSQYLI